MIPNELPQFALAYEISHAVRSQRSGQALLVGGCVRDGILGITPKDLDLEVFGIPEDQIEPLLSTCGTVRRVGRAFPVWKVWNEATGQGLAVDVALPRRETKVGAHHTDFSVTLDPFMSFCEAAYRRDFTMNAMGWDMLKGELLDPFRGQEDLKNGVLRHVSGHFAEDPLRVLRGAQFCARFGLRAHGSTEELCSTLTPEHLSAERLWEEWSKLILKGVQPSRGLTFLRNVGWLKHFPELAALDGIPQDPEHHPEGCALAHTLYCLDAFADTRTGDAREDLIVGLAVLCHDLGKATTTELVDGRYRAHGHEAAGEAPTKAFLGRMTNEEELINDVVSLVVNHMRPTFLWKEATKGETLKAMNRSVRRLAREVRLDRLARVVWCDKAGRPPKPKVSPEADWLRERAAELGTVTKGPEPLLKGRHLMVLGLQPGVVFGSILKEAFERQLDGDILDMEGALAYAKAKVEQMNKE